MELHHSPPQPKRLSYFLTASYKGGTTVGAGTLVANAYGALGTGNVTVSGGTLTESASFALTGGQALIVSGGAASLSKANNYGGGTTVSSGTLVAANTSGSATGSGPVTVGSSGTLGGSGFLSGAVTVLSGGQLAPSAGVSGGTTTLTLGGGLTLAAGSSLDFNFGLVGGSPASDLAVVNGALSLPSSGTVALNVNAPGGLGAGSYDFLNYSGNLTQGGTGSFSLPTSSTYSYTIDIATKNGMNELLLNVAVAAGPVTWAGGGAGTWTGTGVWQNGATYADGYPVTFDNSATGTTSVMLNSTVRPSSVTFSNTSGGSGGKAYTISGNGTLADAPGGTGTTLTVSGGGTVTLGILTGGYTYSGQTTVSNNSTLILDGSTIQSSNVTVTGANLGVTTRGGTIGQTLSVGGTSDLLDGGSLSVTGQTTVTDGTFIIGNGTGNVTLNANGGLAVSGGSIAANNAASNDTINIGSGRLLSYTSSTGSLFQGVLGGNGGLLLNSTPIDGVAATLELANGNSYGGGTTVQSGLLQLDRGDALPAGTPGSDGTPAGEMLLISEIGGNGSAPTPGVVLNSFLMSAGEMGYGGSSGGPVAAPADISAVPEPATPLLLAAAAVLALLAAWRRLAAAAAAQ